MKVYIVGIHDESWGNHGDYILHAFTDEKLADEQAEWYNDHLSLLEGDGAYVEEIEVSDKVFTKGEGMLIAEFLYHSFDEEES